MNEAYRINLRTYYHQLLRKIERPGIKKLIKDYGILMHYCPASKGHHLNCRYGLIMHSVEVYFEFKQKLINMRDYSLSEESIIIISLFHDICKVGLYIEQPGKKLAENYYYTINPNHPKGHGKLSVDILERYICLTDEEKLIIKYHMGIWGAISKYNKDYTIDELTAAIKENYLVQIFANADYEASRKEVFL